MKTHLKKYWPVYTIAVLAIGIITYINWDTIKGWFSPSASRTTGPGSSSRNMCISLGGGDCSYLGLVTPCTECSKRGIQIK